MTRKKMAMKKKHGHIARRATIDVDRTDVRAARRALAEAGSARIPWEKVKERLGL
jgi:hypothetical protein